MMDMQGYGNSFFRGPAWAITVFILVGLSVIFLYYGFNQNRLPLIFSGFVFAAGALGILIMEIKKRM